MRVGPGDKAAHLLRKELEKLAKAGSAQRPLSQGEDQIGPLERLRQRLRERDMSAAQFQRELVACALQTGLGFENPNDTRFQDTVSRIDAMIAGDADMQAMVSRIRTELKSD